MSASVFSALRLLKPSFCLGQLGCVPAAIGEAPAFQLDQGGGVSVL